MELTICIKSDDLAHADLINYLKTISEKAPALSGRGLGEKFYATHKIVCAAALAASSEAELKTVMAAGLEPTVIERVVRPGTVTRILGG